MSNPKLNSVADYLSRNLAVALPSFKSIYEQVLGFTCLYSIDGTKTTCLIDSGATLSFMSTEHVKERGYPTIKLAKPIHLQLAAANAKAEVSAKTKDLKVVGRSGREATISFHIIEMADDCVIGQDLFAKLGIFIGGVSTKVPMEESNENTDALVEIPRLKEISTKDLISGTDNKSDLFYLYLN